MTAWDLLPFAVLVIVGVVWLACSQKTMERMDKFTGDELVSFLIFFEASFVGMLLAWTIQLG